MAKGFFTQGVCLLTDGETTIEHIQSALQEHGFEIVKQIPAGENWCFSGPTVIIPFIPKINGYAAVDVVKHMWPDTMGNVKTDPMIFGAWAMGQFGPLTFPGGLARAGQHSWAWEGGRTVADLHQGFIRIRLSYAFGAKDDDPIWPADCDPVAELHFLSRAVLALIGAPGVICYFNPNGEVLSKL